MQKNPRNSIFIKLFPFLLPFLLWCFLFKDYLNGTNSLGIDGFGFYAMYKFYFNNILNGVFPLWEPYNFVGSPFYLLTSFGFFNPFNYLMLLGVMGGLDYHASHVIAVVSYLWAGHIGFYFLARTIFKDAFIAYCGYVIILFSGISASIFNQPNMLMMYVPTVWFFHFMFQFSQHPGRRYLYGMTFCGMIMMTSYLPFYPLTLFLSFVILYILFYSHTLKNLISIYGKFIRHHKISVVICLISFFISCIPAYIYTTIHTPDDIVNPSRHCAVLDEPACFDIVMKEGGDGGMSYRDASTSGSLGDRVSFHDLFAHLDKMPTNVDDCFFISVFVYLVLIMSMGTPLSRPLILLGVLSAFFVLLGLGAATPLHRFLYDHIFYFHYFRNLFFFMVFIMPLLVLMALHQLKSLMNPPVSSQSKTKNIGIVISAHLIFLVFLMIEQNIIIISYVTVLLSMIFWIFFYSNISFKKSIITKLALITLILAQPVFVFFIFNQNASYHYNIPKNHVTPQFSYLRPTTKTTPDELKFFSAFFYNDIVFKDANGHITLPGTAARWAFYLSRKLEGNIWVDYTKHKFLLYDHVEEYDEKSEDIARIRPTFESLMNTAYVPPGHRDIVNRFPLHEHSQRQAIPLTADSDTFRVLNFNVNRLSLWTNFHVEKFLVYNDNFHHNWNVYVNGKPEKLYRANLALKGVVLPAGENTVTFRFEPLGGSIIYILLIIYFHLFFFISIYLFARRL